MEMFESHVRQVIQASLQKPPEEMLGDCLSILIEISGADGGSILGEEGPHLQFLFSNVPSLIGHKVPWDSIAGATTKNGVIIYTFAPKDKRHYDGVDREIARQTQYLLSIPVPSVHRATDEGGGVRSAGALQLLFDKDIFPEFDVSSGPKEFPFEIVREQSIYSSSLQEVFWILPNISFGLEVMKLRQTSYQAIHELKNKLISAASWLGCLKEDIEDTSPGVFGGEDIDEDYGLAHSAIAEGANLAKSYLQFTKLYTPHFEDTDLNAVLKETAASIRAFAADSGSDDFCVDTDLDDSMPVRQMDPSQLKMAFFNLGKNGTEALLEHRAESPTLRLTSQFTDSSPVVIIEDNGPGMPTEIAENLFVPFKTKKQGGTGLGLTITKKIIEVHGGSINCKTGSEGTRFTIQF